MNPNRPSWRYLFVLLYGLIHENTLCHFIAHNFIPGRMLLFRERLQCAHGNNDIQLGWVRSAASRGLAISSAETTGFESH
jgi:hypothetical protein